jgi:hypothetical protein
LISYLDFKVFTGKFTNGYIENQKNVDAIAPNVRRYVHVGAESRWRVFLHSWCDAGLCGYYFILALAKTVTPRGSPRRLPGQAAPLTT